MRPISRFISAGTAVIALATLAACGSVPMNSQGNSSYPSTPYPNQSQYPQQYPNQYPSQYPTQNPYPPQAQQNPNYVEYGRVTNVEAFQAQEQVKGSGLGAVLGGVAGAVLGRQVGGGTGRDVATVVGVVGGAVAGNAIEKNRTPGVSQAYRITVQLDNGPARAYDLPSTGDIRIGDRVRVQNGQLFRY